MLVRTGACKHRVLTNEIRLLCTNKLMVCANKVGLPMGDLFGFFSSLNGVFSSFKYKADWVTDADHMTSTHC